MESSTVKVQACQPPRARCACKAVNAWARGSDLPQYSAGRAASFRQVSQDIQAYLSVP